MFAGPPCSGKSRLAKDLAAALDIARLELDVVRQLLTPSEHTRDTRLIAYRAIGLLSEHLLGYGRAVILDATYGPFEARRYLVEVSRRRHTPIYLIQCAVTPQEAVRRLSERQRNDPNHGAIDLTPERVAKLAGEYPYAFTGVRLPADASIESLTRSVRAYVDADDAAFDPNEWTRDPGGGPI